MAGRNGRMWTLFNRTRRPRRTCANGHLQHYEGHALCSICQTEFRYPSSYYTKENIREQRWVHMSDFGLHRCSSGHFYSVDASHCPRCADLPPEIPDSLIQESEFTIILGPDDLGVHPSYTGRVVYTSESGSSGNAQQEGHNSQEPVAVAVGRGGGQRNGNRDPENGTQNQPVGEASTSQGSGLGRGTRRGRGTDRGHGSEQGHGTRP